MRNGQRGARRDQDAIDAETQRRREEARLQGIEAERQRQAARVQAQMKTRERQSAALHPVSMESETDTTRDDRLAELGALGNSHLQSVQDLRRNVEGESLNDEEFAQQIAAVKQRIVDKSQEEEKSERQERS